MPAHFPTKDEISDRLLAITQEHSRDQTAAVSQLLAELRPALEEIARQSAADCNKTFTISPTRTLSDLTSAPEILFLINLLFDQTGRNRLRQLSVNEHFLVRLLIECSGKFPSSFRQTNGLYSMDAVSLAAFCIWETTNLQLQNKVNIGDFENLLQSELSEACRLGLIVTDVVDPLGDQLYINPLFLAHAQSK